MSGVVDLDRERCGDPRRTIILKRYVIPKVIADIVRVESLSGENLQIDLYVLLTLLSIYEGGLKHCGERHEE